MTVRGPNTTGPELSAVEADVLALLDAGLSRAAVAAERRVSAAAVTHTCKRLERKGYALPPRRDGGFHTPAANYRVGPLLARGLSDGEIAGELGVSRQRVGQVRRRIERQGASA